MDIYLFMLQAMYGTVVVFLILQALLKLQYSHQACMIYAASVLFYAAGFILWNLGEYSYHVIFTYYHFLRQ